MAWFRRRASKPEPPRDASAIFAPRKLPRDASKIAPLRRKATAIGSPPPSPEEARRRALTAKADDIDLVRKAVDDASAFVRSLWVTFVTLGVYLLMSAGSVTHRQLFLETPIKLPLLDVQLPLVAFFVIAPAIFLIFHVYLLLQIGLLSGKVGRFNELVGEANLDGGAETDLRRLLPNDVLVQYLAGPDDKRRGRTGRRGIPGQLMRLTTYITMVLGPLAVLLFIQLRFLPYQNEWVTLWQRGCVVLDVIALALLWGRATARSKNPLLPWPVKALGSVAMSGVVVAFSCLAMTFPGETLDELAWSKRFHEWAVRPLEPNEKPTLAPEAPLEPELRPEVGVLPEVFFRLSDFRSRIVAFAQSPFPTWTTNETSREKDWLERTPAARRVIPATLQLYGETLIVYDELDKLKLREPNPKPGEGQRLASARRRSLVAADLSYAVLNRVDLREAELTNAFAAYAKLDQALLDGASFKSATLDGAQLQSASLNGVQFQGATLNGAQLQGTSLNNAQFQEATLNCAQLQGASFYQTNLTDASLYGAGLQSTNIFNTLSRGARFDHAQLQGARLGRSLRLEHLFDKGGPAGAVFSGADLAGASFFGAQLQGATLDGAQLYGASFENSELQGATLKGADLRGATLDRAQLQGADLSNSQLQGATLNGAVAYRTMFDNSNTRYSVGNINYDRVRYKITSSEALPFSENEVINWSNAAKSYENNDETKEEIIYRFDKLNNNLVYNLENRLLLAKFIENDQIKSYAIFLGDLACHGGRFDFPILKPSSNLHIARGIIRNNLIQAAKNEAASIAALLRSVKINPEFCPNVVDFTDDDWRALDDAVKQATEPGQISEFELLFRANRRINRCELG